MWRGSDEYGWSILQSYGCVHAACSGWTRLLSLSKLSNLQFVVYRTILLHSESPYNFRKVFRSDTKIFCHETGVFCYEIEVFRYDTEVFRYVLESTVRY
jgi:hypothetical protein